MHFSRQYFLIILSMLAVAYAFANEPIDTLENRLKTASNDTLKIDILLKMGDHYEDSDFEKALQHYNKALELSRNSNQTNLSKDNFAHLKELELKSLRQIALHQSSWEYYDDATKNYRTLLEMYSNNIDKENIVFVLLSIGNIHFFQSQWNEALSLYQEALTLAHNNIPKRAADLRLNIATVYYHRGDYVRSLQEYHSAFSIYDSLANYTGVGQAFIGMGNIYSVTNKYNLALDSYQSAIKYLEELNDHAKLAAVYTSLGALYHENKNYDEAEKYYLLTIEKARLANDNFELSNGLVNMAMLYGARNQIADALNYLDQTLEIAVRASNRYIENVALRSKAVNHAKLGNFPLALKLAKESLEIAKEIKSIDDQAEGYKTLSEINQKMGDNLNALLNYQQYKALNDSLLNIDTQRQLNEMQVIYQTEKQEQKIEVQNLEIKKNRAEIKRKNQIVTTIIGLMVLIVVVASVVLYFNTKEKMRNQDIARQKQIIINNMNKIKNLESKINKQNEIITKLETHNNSWKLKISDHQLFARNVLKTTTGDDEVLNLFFPGKSFTYPNTENELPIDISYYRKLGDEYLIVIADFQMNKLNKTMVNLAMSTFTDQLMQNSLNINPGYLGLKLKEFFESITELQRLPSPIIKLAVICINTQTKKIKTATEHISVFLAISRNSQSIFRPMYEYHELQRLITDDKNAENEGAHIGTTEFKLKATDRLYIINAGITSTTEIDAEYENPIEAGIVRMIDTNQNMEIDIQGQYLRKELRIIASREKNLVPGILSIRGIEL